MEQPIGGYHRPVLLEETLAALENAREYLRKLLG